MESGFILGLIAGEGSFSTNKRIRNGKFVIRPIFHLTMKDSELVSSIAKEMGIGGISHKSDGTTQWGVHSLEEVVELCNFIDSNGSNLWGESDKREAFDIWKDIVQELDLRDTATISNHDDAIRLMEMSRDINKNYKRKSIEKNWEERIEELNLD